MVKDTATDNFFHPPRWSRNAHLQSVCASLKFRLRGQDPPRAHVENIIFSCLPGVRLAGVYWKRPEGDCPGLVLLIHGWLGGADSAYMVSTARYLYHRGFEIFRLNLRDHGRTEDLNEDLFHGARLEETAGAVAAAACLRRDIPFYLAGFSLGGNFALRIAINQAKNPIPNLRQVFAISPALDPEAATAGIDRAPAFYRFYFLSKWKRSLKRKARFFPDKYDFSRFGRSRSCMALTQAMMPFFPEFSDRRDYFGRYTIGAPMLENLAVPTSIFASRDDPVLPRESFSGLASRETLDMEMQEYGGHCGFLDPFPFECWYERRIAAKILAESR